MLYNAIQECCERKENKYRLIGCYIVYARMRWLSKPNVSEMSQTLSIYTAWDSLLENAVKPEPSCLVGDSHSDHCKKVDDFNFIKPFR